MARTRGAPRLLTARLLDRGLRAWGFGFRVWGSRVWGLGLGVLGFGV